MTSHAPRAPRGVRARVTALRAHPTIRNSGWMLGGYAARLVLQLGAFALLARVLGAEQFGAFAGTLALATILGPFVELGGFSLIVRDAAEGRPLGRAVGNSLLVVAWLLPAGALVTAALKPVLLPMVPWSVVLAVAIGELLGTRLLQLALAVNLAERVLRRSAVMEVGSGALRLVLVLVLWAIGGGLERWAVLVAVHGVLAGGVALAWVVRHLGGMAADAREARARLEPGLHFALGSAAQSFYTDIDKAMLPRLASLEATGLYGAATRLITVAHLPLNAFLSAVYPRFFEAGRTGPRAARALARRILPVTVGWGLVATLSLWLAAPWLPFLLGADFADSVEALRLLAVVPLIQSAYFPFADAMSGSGLQSRRATGQVVALVANVALNFALIPRLGWRGAAIAAIATHTVLLAWYVVAGRTRGLPPDASGEPATPAA